MKTHRRNEALPSRRRDDTWAAHTGEKTKQKKDEGTKQAKMKAKMVEIEATKSTDDEG